MGEISNIMGKVSCMEALCLEMSTRGCACTGYLSVGQVEPGGG